MAACTLLDRLAHWLSGGQSQHVCIARALAPEPRLIVLDEAVNSFDREIPDRILSLLMALPQRNGVAYLFVTHDPLLVRDFAGRLYVMQDSRSVEVDDPLGEGGPVPLSRRPGHCRMDGAWRGSRVGR